MQLIRTHSTIKFIIWCALILLISERVYAGNKPQPHQLPKQTPMSAYQLDESGVVAAHLPDGSLAYNVYEVAMEAMQGRDAFRLYDIDKTHFKSGLLPRSANPEGFGDPYQTAAYKWLESNAEEIGGDGLIWYYRFDNAYNDIVVKAPWGSAFGQAHVAKAFLHAYEVTGNDKYRDITVKALKPYALGIAQGGFQSRMPDGSIFFEEVPTLPASHILNGHMISTVTLLEIGKKLYVPWIIELGKQGVETLKIHLKDYDLGYWSRYDMNPKKGEIIFRLAPRKDYSESPILVDRAILKSIDGGEGTDLDVGAADDAVGAWRISGVEWDQIVIKDERTSRGIFYGPARNCGPLAGGSLQNSYLIMQLPQLKFMEMSKVPKYYLRVDYFDQAPGAVDIEIQDISHGNFMGFRTLAQGTIYTVGSKKWLSAYFPVSPKDLGWFMGPDYQKYHIELLDRLYELTGESVFRVYANRWRKYLDMHTEINPENLLSTKQGCPENNTENIK